MRLASAALQLEDPPVNCQHKRCHRLAVPGAQWCCGSCQLAELVGYDVPAEGNLAHTRMCDLRQRAYALCRCGQSQGLCLIHDHAEHAM